MPKLYLCFVCLGVKYFMNFLVFGATENDNQRKSLQFNRKRLFNF
jgi:hypothetical protein